MYWLPATVQLFTRGQGDAHIMNNGRIVETAFVCKDGTAMTRARNITPAAAFA
jgi:hypothetical protein